MEQQLILWKEQKCKQALQNKPKQVKPGPNSPHPKRCDTKLTTSSTMELLVKPWNTEKRPPMRIRIPGHSPIVHTNSNTKHAANATRKGAKCLTKDRDSRTHRKKTRMCLSPTTRQRIQVRNSTMTNKRRQVVDEKRLCQIGLGSTTWPPKPNQYESVVGPQVECSARSSRINRRIPLGMISRNHQKNSSINDGRELSRFDTDDTTTGSLNDNKENIEEGNGVYADAEDWIPNYVRNHTPNENYINLKKRLFFVPNMDAVHTSHDDTDQLLAQRLSEASVSKANTVGAKPQQDERWLSEANTVGAKRR